jgi:hypothetical protein
MNNISGRDMHTLAANGSLSINLSHGVKYSSNLIRYKQAWEFGIPDW